MKEPRRREADDFGGVIITAGGRLFTRRRRAMWRIGLAFLLGHCCVHCLPQLPTPHLWGIALLAAAGASAACGWRLLTVFLLGVAWAGFAAATRLADDLPAALEGHDVLVRGYVASLPASTVESPAFGSRRIESPQFESPRVESREIESAFVLDVIRAPSGIPPRIRLTWYRTTVVPRPGELWQLSVRLKRRNGFANPGGFDHEAHLFREAIGATGYVRDDARNGRIEEARYRYPILRARAWLAERIALAAAGDPMVGILQGLAVGDTHAVTPRQWRTFQATGTTHLMAISGLHITMVAAVAAWLGGAIVRWRHAQPRGLTAMHGRVLAGGIAAIGYSMLAGLSVPTQRTLIMLAVYFAARWRRRELPVGHAFGLALIGVLLVDPFAPLSPGAWLSFGAVAVILLAVAGRLTRQSAVAGFSRVQMAITIGLAPLLLATFGSLSLISPLTNALAVPLFTLVLVPAVLLGTFAAAISAPAGAIVLTLPTKVLHLCWPVLEWMERQPLAIWYFPDVPPTALIALAVGALLLIAPGIWPIRIVGALLCLPAILYRPAAPQPGDFELALLDVGQGLSAVVRTRTRALVYDTGPAFQSGRDAAELAVLPYLRHRGVRALDVLTVSHGDLDHRGGMKSLLAAMPVGRVLTGPSVRGGDWDRVTCRRGQRWSWDGVQFEILHPGDAASDADNDSSCVLRIQGRAGSALLTGDIEAAAEAELVARGLAHADVVVVPHHGSRTSSSADFVEAIGAQIALVPAGYRNRWGFPAPAVMKRWHAAGALTLSTADSGAIEISFAAAQPLRPRAYRRTHVRYWRRAVAG
jgi:competence protein ComEC